MAAEIGVDRLCWELTDHPEDMFSRRFVAGTPELAAHQARDLGRQQPRQRDSRRDAAGADRRQRTAAAAAALIAAGRTSADLRTTVRNLSTRPFPAQASYGRRLVRLGAQLCAPDGALVNRDYERAWLPATLLPASSVDVPMTLTAPDKPGRYALEVRSGQRGDRLVRGVRVADHQEDVGGHLASSRLSTQAVRNAKGRE